MMSAVCAHVFFMLVTDGADRQLFSNMFKSREGLLCCLSFSFNLIHPGLPRCHLDMYRHLETSSVNGYYFHFIIFIFKIKQSYYKVSNNVIKMVRILKFTILSESLIDLYCIGYDLNTGSHIFIL